MEDNYSAWDILIPDFFACTTEKEKIQFLLRFAVLAPSSHNSQPWKFHVLEDTVEIHPDFSRALPHSDKNNRQLYLSLGCALTNLIVAARHYGFKAIVTPQTEHQHPFLSVQLTESFTSTKDAEHELIYSITERLTNREKYNNTPLPKTFETVLNSPKEAGISFYLLQDTAIKARITDAIMQATNQAMSDKAFRKELSEYVKTNTTKSAIGMPAFGMGIPTLVSYLAPTLIRAVNVGKLSFKTEESLLKKHTPYMGVICSEKDDAASWMKAGALYQRIALHAQMHGLATHPLAAGIQIGEHHRKIQETLNTQSRPQFFFRLGKTNSFPPHSPRLQIDQVTE